MVTDHIKAVSLISLSALVYGFTLQGEFVFDDSEAILKNTDVTSGPLTALLIHDFWGSNISSNYSHKSYRPLTVLTYRLNYHLNHNRLDVFQFKLTNLICHIICCLLVWFTYRLLLRDGSQAGNLDVDVAFPAALLFAVHPVHVEAVAGVVGRADLLAGIFYFLAFLSYREAALHIKHSHAMRGCWFLVMSMVLSGASMMSKEYGITVLGLCIMYEITMIRRLNAFKHLQTFLYLYNSQKYYKPPKFKPLGLHQGSISRMVVVIVTISTFLALRLWVMGSSKPYFQPTDNPAAFSNDFLTRILTYQYIYFLNGLLLIWPKWLCFDWSMGCVPLLESFWDPRVLCVAIVYLYLCVLLRYLHKPNVHSNQKRLVIMCTAMTILPFLPASNVLLTVGLVVGERLLYLPSAGFCLLISIGLHKLTAFDQRKYSKLFYTLYGVLLVSFSLRAWERSRNWQTEYGLFTSALEVCPGNAKVHYNVAKAADARQETNRAVLEYREAIRLYPEYYQAMNNLANLLKNEKEFTEAEYYLREAIKYKADFPAAWMNLAIVLANTGRQGEARDAYLTALTHRHNYPDCYYNLGNLYLEMQLNEHAVESWSRAISLNPRHRLAWTNLLAFLDNSGQTEKAMDLIPTALSELPEAHSIHFIVANILGKVGNFEQAEKHFLKTIELSGSHTQPIHYANLGVLYHRWKRYDKSEEMYQKALYLNPNFKSARENIQSVRKLSNKLKKIKTAVNN